MTRNQRKRLRALSELEKYEARVYQEWWWLVKTGVPYVLLCVTAALVFWNTSLWASIVILTCAGAIIVSDTCVVLRYRWVTGTWPWNPIRRIK